LPLEYSIENKNLKSQFKWSDADYLFTTSDGFVYGFFKSSDKKTFDTVVDVNGSKNPNIVKHDLYKFRISEKGFLSDISDELAEIKACSAKYLNLCKNIDSCSAAGGCWKSTYCVSKKDNGSGYCNQSW